MNKYIKMFMDDHNLKVDERFRIKDHEGEYWFNCDGILLCCVGGNCSYEYVLLLNGVYKVEKLKKEPWKPKSGDNYWIVSCHGNVKCCFNDETISDKFTLEHNLVFKTEKEAHDYEWFINKVDEYKKPFEYGEKNYFFYYDYEDDALYITFNIAEAHQGVIYFDSYDKTKAFIKEVGKDRIKKYMFGIYE